jgi:hypothetical protein
MLIYRTLLQQRGDQVFKQMVHELRLTPSQQAHVKVVVADTRSHIAEVRQEYEQKRHLMIVEAYRKIRGQLNHDQQNLLDRDFVSPAILAELKADASGSRVNNSSVRVPASQ